MNDEKSGKLYFFFSQKQKEAIIKKAKASYENSIKCSFCILLKNGQEVEYTACSLNDKKPRQYDDYVALGHGVKSGTHKKNIKDEKE